MRATVERMISTGSLSAFSANATNGIVSGGAVSGTRPMQPMAARAQSSTPPAQPTGPLMRPPAPQDAGQAMPRGSLLDLSV